MTGGFRLTGSSVAVGPVVLGTMTFGDQVDETTATEMVRMALDAGVTMFDTSNNYADSRGESILGRTLAGVRDEVIIATKVGSPASRSDPEAAGLGYRTVLDAADESLRRLGTDHIDLYYLHRPDPRVPVDETLRALAELVTSGKVRAVGQSNYAAWQIMELSDLARELGAPAISTSQVMYNLLSRRIEGEYASLARHLDLFTVIYNPLAGGLLTGKHRFEERPMEGTRFTKSVYRDRYWNPTVFAAIAALTEIAEESGLTLVELALRWVKGRALVGSTLVGASSVEQLRQNLLALDGPPLDDDVLDACDGVWETLAGVAPEYSR